MEEKLLLEGLEVVGRGERLLEEVREVLGKVEEGWLDVVEEMKGQR